MLISFSVENFRCYADRAVLDLAPRLDTHVPKSGSSWPQVTGRLVALFGPNGAGKSTMVDAIGVLAEAVRVTGRPLFFPSLARNGGATSGTCYAIDFVGADSVRYSYEIVAESWGISYERLSSFPRGSRRLLLERRQESAGDPITVVFGSSLSGPNNEVRKLVRPTDLYLSMALRFGHAGLENPARAIASIRNLDLRNRLGQDDVNRLVVRAVSASPSAKEAMNSLLRAADLGIDGFDVKEPDARFAGILDQDPSAVEDSLHQLLRDNSSIADVLVFTHRAEHGTFELPLGWESAGTKTWMSVAIQGVGACEEGGVLVVDELDASLHPHLVRLLVDLFTSDKARETGAQLIFTTHDVTLLGNDPVRILEPADVWFVEKDDCGCATLYSLDEFDNRRGNNNLKRYMAGKFGAVPLTSTVDVVDLGAA